MSSNLKLAEMLCTRFCHDIIGPVGALSNGAEYLRDEMKNSSSMAADLIESSSKEAVARVQYYRQAYGHAANTSPASLTEMKGLAVNYFAGGKIKLNWSDKYTDMSNIAVTQTQKKLLLNVLIVAAAALIRGGRIDFEISGNQAIFTASGEKAALHENFRLCLDGKLSEEQIDARLIQCYYTYLLSGEANAQIKISESTELVVLTVTF